MEDEKITKISMGVIDIYVVLVVSVTCPTPSGEVVSGALCDIRIKEVKSMSKVLKSNIELLGVTAFVVFMMTYGIRLFAYLCVVAAGM